MTPSTVQVAPDGSGKKIQTFTDGTKHAQAVVLVDSSGNPITSPSIDSTTHILQGDGAGNATASALLDNGSGHCVFRVDENDPTDLSIYNATSDGSASISLRLTTDLDTGWLKKVSTDYSGLDVLVDQDMELWTGNHGNLYIKTARQLFFYTSTPSDTRLATLSSLGFNLAGGHYYINDVQISASEVGLSNVTNDTQTKASIVPNTAPAPNVILIGNAGGTAYVPSTPAFPNASAASGKFIRSDGTNWVASTPSLPTSAGVAGKILRSDGTNYIESTPTYPNSGVAGTIIVSDGTNFVASTPTFPNASASSGKFIRSDGTNWVASTPTLPTTAGVAGKVLYTNGTNYLESVPALPVTAAAITGKIMQSDGTNWIASTATHPTAATLNKVVIGNGTNYVESTPAFPNASAITGKIIQSDGTNWIASTPTFPAAAGTNGNILVSDGTNFTSAARLMQQASGSSTSGTNGTIVARITAGSGNQLVGFTAFADQTTTASTQTNINIVYSDGTFTTASSAPNNAVQMFVNYAAILITQSAQFSSITALSAKKVTSINITTQNTGVGTRGAIISAEEIPIS